MGARGNVFSRYLLYNSFRQQERAVTHTRALFSSVTVVKGQNNMSEFEPRVNLEIFSYKSLLELTLAPGQV